MALAGLGSSQSNLAVTAGAISWSVVCVFVFVWRCELRSGKAGGHRSTFLQVETLIRSTCRLVS